MQRARPRGCLPTHVKRAHAGGLIHAAARERRQQPPQRHAVQRHHTHRRMTELLLRISRGPRRVPGWLAPVSYGMPTSAMSRPGARATAATQRGHRVMLVAAAECGSCSGAPIGASSAAATRMRRFRRRAGGAAACGVLRAASAGPRTLQRRRERLTKEGGQARELGHTIFQPLRPAVQLQARRPVARRRSARRRRVQRRRGAQRARSCGVACAGGRVARGSPRYSPHVTVESALERGRSGLAERAGVVTCPRFVRVVRAA